MSEEEIIEGINEIIEQFYSFPNPRSIEFEDHKVELLKRFTIFISKRKRKK